MTGEGLDRFGLTDSWRTATTEIIRTVSSGPQSSAGRALREGPASSLPLERLARAYCANNPRVELPLAYGVLGVATCIASQGAFMLYCPLKGGGWLKVPAIQHFIGVTPSGGRKSTTLDIGRKPLKAALADGAKDRTETAKRLMNQAITWANTGLTTTTAVVDEKQFEEVFGAGRCPATIVKDPTVEALRDMVVHNGGIAGIVSAEADAFRNLTAYSSDGGSLTFFLDLWDQADIQTARVSRGALSMNNAALPSCVLLQTDVFAEVTAGTSKMMAVTSDSFVTRGMFGRSWVAEALSVSGYDDVARDYSDDDDFEFVDEDGLEVQDGQVTPYGEAVGIFAGALDWLVSQTNDYRMGKALHQAWQQAYLKYGFSLQVPEQPEPAPLQLRLSADARLAYRRVQRMQAAIETALSMESDDSQVLWAPMAARFTQHVMREALVVTLASGSTGITAEIIEDAATRIIPWRWHLSVHALGRRETDRMEMVVAQTVRDNPRGTDLSGDSLVKRALHALMGESTTNAMNGVTREDITRKIKNQLPPKARAGAATLVSQSLEKLLTDLDSGVVKVAALDSTGRPIERYKATLPVSSKPASPF